MIETSEAGAIRWVAPCFVKRGSLPVQRRYFEKILIRKRFPRFPNRIRERPGEGDSSNRNNAQEGDSPFPFSP